MNKLRRQILFGALFLPFVLGNLSAQTVTWGTSVSPKPLGYFSNGTPTNSNLTWTIGYFRNNFIPTAANAHQWAENYQEVDRNVEVFNESFSVFTVAGLKENVGALAAERRAWFFAYNDLTKIGTTAGEVLLFTQTDFIFPPAPSSATFTISGASDDKDWNIVWGRIDRDRDSPNGILTGAGFITIPLGNSIGDGFEAQTATWPGDPAESPFLIASASISDPSQRGENDDPDGDGRNNLLEHAMGTDLTASDSGYAVIESATRENIRLLLPSNRPADVRYTLEYSSTMAGPWAILAQSAGLSPWIGASPLSISPAPSSRELMKFASPTESRGFFRVKFERIVP